MSMENYGLPYAPGNLKNGKPCGAKCKRTGLPCQGPAMANGRCRMHGGKSTGPRTPEGKERSRRGNWKHGSYSVESQEERREFREMIHQFKRTIRELRTQ